MKILYIGEFNEGSTSRMRGRYLKKILSPDKFEVIDTTIPFNNTNKLFRSLGFRYKTGPLLEAVNQYILERVSGTFDLIWIDKAVYVYPKTTKYLRTTSPLLVHFTPDPAFTFHHSQHFSNSVDYYDYLITTKSYEIDHYRSKVNPSKIIFATQGFDKEVHFPTCNFENKKEGVVFIGHYEQERRHLLQHLLNNNVKVTLAGINWNHFVKKNYDNLYLTYLGVGVFKDHYAHTLGSYHFGLGALSKWVPELHTTRTFEIPACGTALLTERNSETQAFFNDHEVIFYKDKDELLVKIKYYTKHLDQLKILTEMGMKKVLNEGYDYDNIMKKVIELLPISSSNSSMN